jgi:aminoglycoside phosphotransferase
MPDPNADRLRRTLEELHELLERSSPVGQDLERPLRQVLDDVRATLERAQDEEASEPRAETFRERLEEIALEFETDHPLIAGTINRLTHALSNMGI